MTLMLRINYTYYNNYTLLKQVIKYYEPVKDKYKFTIIDDGSQREPLTRDMLPDWITGYRVLEDHGWGNEVCKNILMRETDCEWNALMDLDYVIKSIPDIDRLYSGFIDYKFCFQFEKGRSVDYNDFRTVIDDGRMINSFIVSKSSWHQTYGYDMTFGYLYGYDHTFFEQLDKEIVLPDSIVSKIASQGAPEDWRPKPGDQTAFDDVKKQSALYADTGYYVPGRGWNNERERLARCIPFPTYKLIN